MSGNHKAPVVRISEVERALELATSLNEVKDIRDKAEALRIYSRRAGDSLDLQNRIAEIRIRAERRAGEILSRMDKNEGGRPSKNSSHDERGFAATLKELGISYSQSSRWQLIAHIPKEEFERHIQEVKSADKELTSAGVMDYGKYLTRMRDREAKREAAVRAAESFPVKERITIVEGDFRESMNEMPDGSADLILTDPPYEKSSLPLWSDLGAFAARVLKPGRLLLAMSGHFYLPDVMNRLAASLNYVWMVKMIFSGTPNTVYPFWLKTYGKPVLMFAKGAYQPLEDHWLKDVIYGDGMNKESHPYQQGVNESRYLIETLTREGELVVDPFLGSGCNAVAAYSLGRRFIGCDTDEYCVNETKRRLSELDPPTSHKERTKPPRRIVGYRPDFRKKSG